ncbi:alpha/beta hydrolase [Gordonia alkanivorans]|uniref:alpha/beta fold hydrolase n=1 Tax=Gordonia alkanivorans TaxID=84096 RepID=UPI0024B766FB|nr:alpha/beta hydrolase [Gordonia alkanivorans]MDJ0029474.1 alpha/beta hydrolase [Gordonia alkanivorans]
MSELNRKTSAASGVLQRIETPAGTVEYAEDGEGPPVVFLHGLLMDHAVWDDVIPLLPNGFRYIRPILPLGSHRIPLNEDAVLSMDGMVGLVADILDALDLRDVTLVHSDWGGSLFLTSLGRDERVARMVVLPCEAFENFPPGLPGKMATLAVRLPGGITLAARQLRVGWLRRLPVLWGWMVDKPVDDERIRRWTDPVLRDPRIRRDVTKYATTSFDPAELVRKTEALRGFGGEVLVLWSPDNRVMPPAHGPRLAELAPRGRYAEIPGAAVLSMLDEPQAVAREIGAFLTAATRG